MHMKLHESVQCTLHEENYWGVKFIYSEKATKFCEISTVDLSYVLPVKSNNTCSQNFVTFSEYMNFNKIYFSIFSWRLYAISKIQKISMSFKIHTNRYPELWHLSSLGSGAKIFFLQKQNLLMNAWKQ